MLLEKLSWNNVKKYLEANKRVILVLGATEEHSDLSLCTDTLIPFEIAKKSCERENVILLPPLNYGISTWALEYPGTVTLKTSTYIHVIEDIFDSLIYSGFRKFFILNGHGFNRSVAPVIGEKVAHVEGAFAQMYNWYDLKCIKDFALKNNLTLSHANWAENFSFTRLEDTNRGLASSNVTVPNLIQNIKQIKKEFKDGHGFGSLEIDENQINILLNNLVNEFSEILNKGGYIEKSSTY
ncbi:MAG: creatininase family protein [Lactobacillales bacterium]|nr:creatininase family protein [Lactobacillales bacterium]